VLEEEKSGSGEEENRLPSPLRLFSSSPLPGTEPGGRIQRKVRADRT
jgi:hypothetical protein